MGGQAGGRADIDDRAAAAHEGDHGLDSEQRSGQIDRQHALEVVDRDVEEPGAKGDAGVVDEPVDPSELRAGPACQLTPVITTTFPCARPTARSSCRM
jgi:hypothetical protein